VVKVRLSATDGEVTDVDVEATAPEFGRAAEANVRTWGAYVRVPVLTVTYTYRLLSGDCGPDQQSRVVMRFPREVEVTAKRVVPCRP
jgi:hypothetical protein